MNCKTYIGTPRRVSASAQPLVTVCDGQRCQPLPLRLDLFNHSPTGFSWGYGGSGPAQLVAQQLDDNDLLNLFRAVGRVVSKRFLMKRPSLDRWQLVIDYLTSAMAFEPREQFRVLYLDKRNNLIADEVLAEGTVDHTPVYPREVLRRAIELHATGCVLVHNHPSGDATPSRADIDMTKQVIEVCNLLGIAVHDHVIVSRDGHASLRGLRLM